MPPTRKTSKASAAPKPNASIEVDQPAPVVSPPSPAYVVNFSDSDSDRSLLAQIEETLAQHQAIDFSDLCKEALQQLLAPEPMTTAGSPSSNQISNQSNQSNQSSPDYLSPLIIQLQQQVAALEAKITQAPSLDRLEQLESLIISLEQRFASFEVKAEDRFSRGEATPTTPQNPPAKPAIKQASPELDPLLSRLSNLLEDF